MDTILRRMPDYVSHICPQFSRTHVNFQRVPIVDTSNRSSRATFQRAEESFIVIRFTNPRGIDFPYLLSMLHDSFMSRPNTIVAPGGKMGLAMELIFTPPDPAVDGSQAACHGCLRKTRDHETCN